MDNTAEEKTDSELVISYIQGDQSSFELLIKRHTKKIFSFTYRIVGEKNAAEDVTQETFLKVWKNIKKYNQTQKFSSWLFTIARNTAYDYLRKKKPLLFSTLSEKDETPFEETIADTSPLPDNIFEKKELNVLLEKSLNLLNLKEREIVSLHDGEQMTFEEISDLVDEPMNTVKSRYRRGIIKLRDFFDNAPK